MASYEDFAIQLEQRRKDLIHFLWIFKKKRPEFDERNDARLMILHKSISSLTSLEIGFENMFKIMQDPDWSNSYPFDLFIPIKYVKDGYEMFLKMGFIHLYFSGIESSLRIFLRNIDPEVHKNSRGEFKKIYDTLFEKIGFQKYIPLLDLFRHIRNTIHNNGIFMPTDYENKQVKYKGKVYNFQDGKVQLNTSWADILFLVDETIGMMKELLDNPEISRKPDMIDPFSSQVWPLYGKEMNDRTNDI